MLLTAIIIVRQFLVGFSCPCMGEVGMVELYVHMLGTRDFCSCLAVVLRTSSSRYNELRLRGSVDPLTFFSVPDL